MAPVRFTNSGSEVGPSKRTAKAAVGKGRQGQRQHRTGRAVLKVDKDRDSTELEFLKRYGC